MGAVMMIIRDPAQYEQPVAGEILWNAYNENQTDNH